MHKIMRHCNCTRCHSGRVFTVFLGTGYRKLWIKDGAWGWIIACVGIVAHLLCGFWGLFILIILLRKGQKKRIVWSSLERQSSKIYTFILIIPKICIIIEREASQTWNSVPKNDIQSPLSANLSRSMCDLTGSFSL